MTPKSKKLRRMGSKLLNCSDMGDLHMAQNSWQLPSFLPSLLPSSLLSFFLGGNFLWLTSRPDFQYFVQKCAGCTLIYSVLSLSLSSTLCLSLPHSLPLSLYLRNVF